MRRAAAVRPLCGGIEPDLAIFYDDIYEQTIVPVIPMGKAESGAENLRDTSGTVILELMPEESEESIDE
ncbi:MAG TPA: hypothetical protein IAB22_08220 [Candidatus Merdivicinus intestinavium]|nr:hypothetical protein [Candidatus Merdivicinus intestinavium]